MLPCIGFAPQRIPFFLFFSGILGDGSELDSASQRLTYALQIIDRSQVRQPIQIPCGDCAAIEELQLPRPFLADRFDLNRRREPCVSSFRCSG